MTPDRELDAEVAEKVMGWRQDAPGSIWWHDGRRLREVPDYSTQIAVAWQVVERLRSMNFDVEIAIRSGWIHTATTTGHGINPHVTATHCAKTTPLAICRAALAAVTPPSVASDAASPDVGSGL